MPCRHVHAQKIWSCKQGSKCFEWNKTEHAVAKLALFQRSDNKAHINHPDANGRNGDERQRENEIETEEEAWSKIVIISCTSLVQKRIQIETHTQTHPNENGNNQFFSEKLTWKQQREFARDCMLPCMCKNQRVEMISNYHSLNDSMAMANMHDAHVYPGIWMTFFPVHFCVALQCTS